MEAKTLKEIEVLRSFLVTFQWGIVFGGPIWLIFFLFRIAGAIPHVVTATGKIAHPIAFWLIMDPTVIFIACVFSSLASWLSMRMLSWFLPSYFRIYRWYQTTYMLRDWVLMAFAITLLYRFFLKLVEVRIVPLVLVADSSPLFMSQRAPILTLCCVVAILALHSIRWVQQNAVLPESLIGKVGVLFYAIYLLLAFLAIHTRIIGFVLNSSFVYSKLITISASVPIASTILFVGLRLYIGNSLKGAPSSLTLPINTKIGMIAPSGVGKTTFMVRAYDLLENLSSIGTLRLLETDESRKAMAEQRTRLMQDRQFPVGTPAKNLRTRETFASKVPFQLRDAKGTIMIFQWMDLAGGAFTYRDLPENDPDYTAYEDVYKEFCDHLAEADGMMMLFNAQDLATVEKLSDYKLYRHYTKAIDDLYDRMKADDNPRAIPLCIVVTQCCRVSYLKRLFFWPMLQTLVDLYKNYSIENSLPSPAVKIFLTSAVITKDNHNSIPTVAKEKVLRSENCVEAVAWMAGRIMRSKVGLLDLARGFATRPNSKFQQCIMQIEDAS